MQCERWTRSDSVPIRGNILSRRGNPMPGGTDQVPGNPDAVSARADTVLAGGNCNGLPGCGHSMSIDADAVSPCGYGVQCNWRTGSNDLSGATDGLPGDGDTLPSRADQVPASLTGWHVHFAAQPDAQCNGIGGAGLPGG